MPWYSWIHEDPFRSCFLASTMTLSLLSNGLLLFIIFTTNSTSIGSYRYLLAVFAVCDVITSFAHASLHPIMHLTSNGLYFFPRKSIIIDGESYDTVCCVIFVAIYYQTFLILAYHFVYRLKTVTSGVSSSFTDSWKRSHWTALAIIVDVLYITGYIVTCALAFTPDDVTRALAPKEIEEIYGVNLQNLDRGCVLSAPLRPDPVTGVLVWHLPSVASLLIFIGMFGTTASVILYCIWRVSSVFKYKKLLIFIEVHFYMSSDYNFTAKTKQLQLDLFRALLIQSAVPMLFSYFPLATILIFPPVTGISLGAFGNVLFSTTAIFPCIDALFVLFFIGRFRMAMSDPRFSWSYEEPFHMIFLASTMSLAILSNGLLLYIIFTTKSSTIGSYRYLLAVFAGCDIITSFSHMSLQPILHMTRGGIYFIGRHGPIMIGGQSFDMLFTLIFAATYFQTFLILTYHFVYRFKAMASVITRSFTDNWTNSQWTTLGVVINIAYITVVILTYGKVLCCDDETRALASPIIMDVYGIDLQDRRRWFIAIAALRPDATGEMVHHVPTLFGLLILSLCFGVTGSTIIYCITKINGMIRSTKNQLTAKTREMQLDLYHALLTAVPMVISYLPCAAILLVPSLTNITLGTFGNVLYLSTSIFPSIDAFFILFFIRRFRVATIRLLRIPFITNSVAQSSNLENRN